MLLVFDRGCEEAAKLATSVAGQQDQDDRLRQELNLLDVSGMTLEDRTKTAMGALMSGYDCERFAAAKTDLECRARQLAFEPCWFRTPDGVAGPVFIGSHAEASEVGTSIADPELFFRELSYHSTVRRLSPGTESERLARVTVENRLLELPTIVPAVLSLLEQSGAVVLRSFLGELLASEMASLDFGDFSPACPSNDGAEASPGAGRGDWAVLPQEAPTQFLEKLDSLVAALRCKAHCENPISAAARLELCEFRTWPMVSSYGPGARYTWHVDNGQSVNGRLLTCVYYLNPGWNVQDRGQLRLLEWEPSARPGDAPILSVLAEVPPDLDTLVLFWSDQVPHEVLPPLVETRRAISVWYLCPRLGAEHFEADNAEPAFGQTKAEAANKVLHAWTDADATDAAFNWLCAAANSG